jgi:hypothetical protein
MTFDTRETGLREQMESYRIRQRRVSSWDDIQQAYPDYYENQAAEEEDKE